MNPSIRRWAGPLLLAGVVVGVHALGLNWLRAHLFSTPLSASPPPLRMAVRQVEQAMVPKMMVEAPRVEPAAIHTDVVPVAVPTPIGLHKAKTRDPSLMLASTPASPAAAPASPPRTPRTDKAVAAQVPAPARWRYSLRLSSHGIELSGQSELTWRHDGKTYEAQLDMRAPPAPTRTQRSTGRLGSEGLEPLRFSERRRSEQATHFDRDRKRIVFSNNQPEAELAPGAQDRLSVLLQLGVLLEPQRTRMPEIIELQVAGTQDAEVWRFRYEGDESLDLPGGPQRTHRLVRLPRKDFDQKVELWLAPGLADAPARLRLTSPNGEWLDLQWLGTDRP